MLCMLHVGGSNVARQPGLVRQVACLNWSCRTCEAENRSVPVFACVGVPESVMSHTYD